MKGHRIDVGGTHVEVVRKDIKNLHIGVYPPSGRVRVAAPLRLDDDAVRLAVISRLGWIRRRQAEFERQERQSQRDFVTGESHYFEGRRYRLDVVEGRGRPGVRLVNNSRMALQVRPGADREEREAVLHRWYRRQLRGRLPPLLAKWEPEVGERVAEVRIRKMKTRWGTCTAVARRFWLNLELAKKPALMPRLCPRARDGSPYRAHPQRPVPMSDGRSHAAVAHPSGRAEPSAPCSRRLDVLRRRCVVSAPWRSFASA